FNGHFNVLRGYLAPIDTAGVKIVGDYVENYKRGLPSEMALLNLFDPRTGMPRALLDATAITDMRTGAVTALGAKYLARKGSRVLGHIGARGTAYWNVRLLDHLFGFAEIRIHSRRKESRDAFGAKLSRDLGKTVTVSEDWESCLKGADIVVEASRLDCARPGGWGELPARRRHRRRAPAPQKADAAPEDRVDQAGRLRRALRH